MFDFKIQEDGELVVTNSVIEVSSDDDMRLQNAYTRIKSVANDWFIDHIGANLEVLVGRSCNSKNAEIGKALILNSLINDGLWNKNELLITANITSNTSIEFDVIFKIYQGYSEDDVIIREIIASLDLVKGVHIKYGWEPRR